MHVYKNVPSLLSLTSSQAPCSQSSRITNTNTDLATASTLILLLSTSCHPTLQLQSPPPHTDFVTADPLVLHFSHAAIFPHGHFPPTLIRTCCPLLSAAGASCASSSGSWCRSSSSNSSRSRRTLGSASLRGTQREAERGAAGVWFAGPTSSPRSSGGDGRQAAAVVTEASRRVMAVAGPLRADSPRRVS